MTSLERCVACVLVLALGIWIAGCGSSSIDSMPPEGGLSGESLNAEQLDALTAAGESGDSQGFEAPAFEGGFPERGSDVRGVSGPLPSGAAQLPSRQPIRVPSIGQSNSIRQVR